MEPFSLHDANQSADPTKTMSIVDLMNYLNDTLIYDETFAPLMDEETVNDIRQNAEDIDAIQKRNRLEGVL